MRSFADTLPTLRESGASQPIPAVKEQARFNPLLLTRPPKGRPDAAPGLAELHDDDGAGEPNVADIRRALLKRQGAVEGSATGDSSATPASATAASAGLQALTGAASPAPAGRTASAPAGETAAAKPSGPRPAASVVPPFVTGSGASTSVSLAQQVEEAVAEARRQMEAEKDKAVEFARKVERDVAARAVADAREKWCKEEGEAFARRCAEGFDALHQMLSDAFGRALAPIAEAVIRDAAVRRFAAMLDDLVGASAASPAVTVRGPAQLVAALRQASGETGVAFEEVDGETDLSVTVDETTLRTTIDAWAETLAQTLGGGR